MKLDRIRLLGFSTNKIKNYVLQQNPSIEYGRYYLRVLIDIDNFYYSKFQTDLWFLYSKPKRRNTKIKKLFCRGGYYYINDFS